MKGNVTVITRRGEEREEEKMMVRQSRESHSRAATRIYFRVCFRSLDPFSTSQLDLIENRCIPHHGGPCGFEWAQYGPRRDNKESSG